ncbi:MAG TPA: peptidyl-prolyl cis-trans isomerase [Acidobacteriaceae bacterium]|jgi:peptidyl-prolyl cis-trans isomerase SurA
MIKKQSTHVWTQRLFAGAWIALGAASASTLHAQVQARPRVPAPAGNVFTQPSGSTLQLPPVPAATPVMPNGSVVEDVIARINDQVITRSEYERAQQQLLQEAQQQGVNQAEFQDRQQNMLRDMIDQQLLLSKGKELGITGDAETMRQLDEIRKSNHLDSMEALEKAAAQQGVSFEDFKQGIRNQIIQQQVVRDEVGRRLNMTHAEEEAFYNAHIKEFEAPEQVHLSEILIPTPDNATDAQVTAAQAKADGVEATLKGGANFAATAKTQSGGPTATAGGDLGDFKRGVLGDVLEKATFSLPAGGYTEPIRTRQGFVILRVDSHQAAGTPPLADVEQQVQNALYMQNLQPALRAYLTKARDEAYVDVKPGFVDTGINHATGRPLFTTYTPPPVKKKVVKHQAAEQRKAEHAQEMLAAARAKVQQKNEARAAAQAARNGGTPVSRISKPPKIRREKVRFGQAPRNALPAAPPSLAADTTPQNPPLAGQAPGAAMASQDSSTSISIGTGLDQEDPLAPKAVATHKTRFSARQNQHDEQIAQTNLVKAEAKASTRPIKATVTESTDEKQQAAPLGLNGDTVKKKKAKREKGAPKERLQEKTKPEEKPLDQTVNPALGAAPVTNNTNTTTTPKPSSDTTALPPADAPAPGALPAGQPIPATTGTQPASTTPAPH